MRSLQVKLTIYLFGGRTLSCVYTRKQAAMRLRLARHLEDFKDWNTEAA